MQILDKNSANSKWTVLFEKSSRYPKPGEIIAVSEEDIKVIIAKANIELEKNGTFLMSKITNMSDQNYYGKVVFAPCQSELNSSTKFDLALTVEEVVIKGNKHFVKTNCPFINMPDSVQMLFNIDDVSVIDVRISSENPNVTVTGLSNVVTYTTKSNSIVEYTILCDAPEKIVTWICENLIKEFSLIFDFTKEIESAVAENSLTHNISKISDSYANPYLNKITEEQESFVEVKQKVKAKSLNDVNFDELDENYVISLDESSFISSHPLYNYTSEIVTSVFDEIENECKLSIAHETVIRIMSNMLMKMTNTEIQVTPPYSKR